MTDVIVLSCSSCGGKLQLTPDIERFACSYCGTEQIVKRSGGIVTLTPVVDAIKQVGVGVDKTASELAMARIQNEITILRMNKKQLWEHHPRPKVSLVFLVMGILGLVIFMCGLVTYKDNGLLPIIIAFVMVCVGVLPYIINIYNVQRWEATTGSQIGYYDGLIAQKIDEYNRHHNLVSQ